MRNALHFIWQSGDNTEDVRIKSAALIQQIHQNVQDFSSKLELTLNAETMKAKLQSLLLVKQEALAVSIYFLNTELMSMQSQISGQVHSIHASTMVA